MIMAAMQIDSVATVDGLTINGQFFDKKLPLERYEKVLGPLSRTIDAGPPAPFGHRNNQVHIFDSAGIYLTEHHASRLIESVNFVFDPAECPFPIQNSFRGDLSVGGQCFRANMLEASLEGTSFERYLPGEYSLTYKNCWIGVATKARRDSSGKRRKPRYVVRVSVCL